LSNARSKAIDYLEEPEVKTARHTKQIAKSIRQARDLKSGKNLAKNISKERRKAIKRIEKQLEEVPA